MTMTLVQPSGGTRLVPLDAAGVRVRGGFWAERLSTNRTTTIPHGLAQLEDSGALGNFRNAARRSGRYIGGIDDAGLTFPFLDSDVYKWLEAVAWELGREADDELTRSAGEVIEAVAAAQREDGYLNTFVQLSGRRPYEDLQWGHELYCIGHLAQAAVAWQRSLGDGRLVAVAEAAVHHIDAALGAAGQEGIGGHPEIEMALVELYRVTGHEQHLRLASLFVERRGRGLLGTGRMGSRYWQDHLPVREAPSMTGHAVRQLYLDCGVVDVAVETRDDELLGSAVRRWEDMWATRTYLTGALGSRHRDEAFGDTFELPPDRAYAETCAAIASVMLAWRLLLATGQERFADALERTLYNAVLPGISADGSHFFYTNPLQLRDRPGAQGAAAGRRLDWYACACCPPNLMRTLSSFEHVLATSDATGLQVHQFADASLEAALDRGDVALEMTTDYPRRGRVEVRIVKSPTAPWDLRLRVPAWAQAGTLEVNGEQRAIGGSEGSASSERVWRPGDRVILDLAMPPRVTSPDPRIDAVRGCVAIERGPLVYCLEQTDLADGVALEAVETDANPDPDLSVADDTGVLGMPSIEINGRVRPHSERRSTWPYQDAAVDEAAAGESRPTTLVAVPYFAWGNRQPGPMRVWIPAAASPVRE